MSNNHSCVVNNDVNNDSRLELQFCALSLCKPAHFLLGDPLAGLPTAKKDAISANDFIHPSVHASLNPAIPLGPADTFNMLPTYAIAILLLLHVTNNI